MKINVVTVTSGWILQKWSERIVKKGCELGHEFILSHASTNNADCNLYVDIQNCYHRKTDTLDIGVFTHIDRDDIRTLDLKCLSLDHIVHMCTRYYERFKSIYSEEKMSMYIPGEGNSVFPQYKPKLGIYQRGMYEGKGYHFMLKIARNPLLQKFRFKFIGKDWDGVVNLLRSNGVEVEYFTDETYKDYPGHVHDVDYVYIPSLWEGGPMAILEGLAAGKPVISTDVGLVGDLDVDYVYPPNNDQAFFKILNEILEPIERRRKSTEDITYENYVNNIITLITRLKNEET